MLKKKATEHGTWFLLQHVQAAQEIWFGSGYLSTGIKKDARTSEVQCLLEGLPPTAEMAILGADLNTRLDWEDDGDVKYVSSSAGKTQAMIDHFGSRRLQGIPQVNVHTPTYWTRKTPSSSSQIDGFFTNALGRCSEVCVQEASRKIIGSDHEVIEVDIRLQFAERPRKRSGGPRVVRQDITIQVNEVAFLDQKEIEKLATKYTVPVPKVGVEVPQDVKDLGKKARSSRSRQDWIVYSRALRNARVMWREAKLDAACHDWSAFHWAKKQKNTRWQECFADARKPTRLSQSKSIFRASSIVETPTWMGGYKQCRTPCLKTLLSSRSRR